MERNERVKLSILIASFESEKISKRDEERGPDQFAGWMDVASLFFLFSAFLKSGRRTTDRLYYV